MPEGHTVHRVAGEFTQHFVGNKVTVTSPQGRFASGASVINGRVLTSATAIGKQLFLHFGDSVLRIHLGIYGKWGFADFVDEPPTAIGQVRARFIAGHRIADLRGPTACDLIDGHELLEITKRLGPDPLNADPKQTEVERFVAKVQKSTKSIALLLMDQSVIAGVGNVYRAELLFRAGLEPHRPGSSIAGETLREIWNDAAYLMRFGVDTGIMVTRDELLGSVPDFDERYFVYKRIGEACRVCGRAVSLEMLGGRKLYWCANCQS